MISPDAAAGPPHKISRVSTHGPDNPLVPFTADEAEQTSPDALEQMLANADASTEDG
jgi:hypothetical protein